MPIIKYDHDEPPWGTWGDPDEDGFRAPPIRLRDRLRAFVRRMKR
jgi:hypothetical protein